MKKIAVVINPSSAGGRTLELWPTIAQKLEADGYTITSHISLSEPDFRNQLRQFSHNFKYIGICGGDSSLTIAAEELYHSKFRGELRFLPAGSVNDIVLDIREQAVITPIHLGSLSTDTYAKNFIGQANWGLGVVVNRWVGNTLRALPFLRPLQNLIGFFCIVFSHLLRREIIEAEIIADEKIFKGRFSIILVSQIRHWAGGLRFCPDADFATPEFQVVLVSRQNLVQLFKTIHRAKTGGVEAIAARAVEITFSREREVQIDGDISASAKRFELKKLKTHFSLRS